MKKNHFTTHPKLCVMALLGAGAMLMASCAVDGFEDETVSSDVHGVTLESPNAADITVTNSADGKTQTFTWPVVDGAGGYLVSFYDAANMSEPIVNDSIVDGCSITVNREEDMNYLFTIRTLGNPKLNNAEAAQATSKEVTTFTPTYMTIPDGSDLNEWFAANPIPETAKTENLNYDLVAGGSYTVSSELDFDPYSVTLRSTSKTNHAKITYVGGAATISFANTLNVKYLDFDCAGMPKGNTGGVFGFSKSPTAERDAATGFVIIQNPVTIIGCNFDNVMGSFFTDNRKGQKVAAVTFLIDNCVVHLTPESAVKCGVIWTNNGGHINDFTISNSTFYNLEPSGDIYYFYQAGGYRAKDIGLATNSVNYLNSTFYRIGNHNTSDWGEWGNYNGMNGKTDSYWVMTNCIFFDCSNKGGVPRRFLHGKTNQPTATFANNTYMAYDGTFQSYANYDNSGTVIEEDPKFADPSVADFHISGTTQVARKTGDPRWLP